MSDASHPEPLPRDSETSAGGFKWIRGIRAEMPLYWRHKVPRCFITPAGSPPGRMSKVERHQSLGVSITSSETTPRAHVTQRVDERPECGYAEAREPRRGAGDKEQSAALTRPRVSFIAWAEDAGRAHEVAQALGGEACTLYRLRIVWKPLVPLRYLLNAISTCIYLLSRRPRAVIVTNPPIFPGLIACPYCIATKAPLLLDSHPSAFGEAPMAKQVGRRPCLARAARSDNDGHCPGTGGDRDGLGRPGGHRPRGAPGPPRRSRPARSRAGRASCTSAGSPAMSRPRRWLRRRGWCPRQTC